MVLAEVTQGGDAWQRVRERKTLAKLPQEVRKRLYYTSLDEQYLGDPVKDRHRPALFCDGVVQTLARYPNEGFVYGGRALGATPIPPVENGNSGTVVLGKTIYKADQNTSKLRDMNDCIYFATTVDPSTWSK